MSSRSLPARRKASRPESWPVVWRVTMPAVRPGDPDWHWYDGDDETEARRKCTALRRCGWPVRLERIEQQPLMPAGVVKVETLRAEHERSQQSTPAH